MLRALGQRFQKLTGGDTAVTADGSSAQPGTGVGTDTAAGPGEGASGGEGGAGAVALSVGPQHVAT